MNRFTSTIAVWALAALMMLCVPQVSDALGLRVKAGVNLTRQQQFDTFYGLGGQFDAHRWMVGSNLDLGAFVLPKLHLVPGVDLAVKENLRVETGADNAERTVKENLRVYTLNLDAHYFFYESSRSRGYAGVGCGIHFFRLKTDQNPETVSGDTKISLNVPLGYQRKLGGGLAWFGEMKLVIADDEKDSALQFAVGLNFGM